MEEDDKKIRIRDKEGQIHEVDERIRKYSVIINDIYNNDPEEEILILLKTKQLSVLLEYFRIHDFNPKFTQQRPVTSADLRVSLGNDEDYEFFGKMSEEEILEVLNTAKYLHINILQDLCLTIMASQILKLSGEEKNIYRYKKLDEGLENDLIKKYPWSQNELKFLQKNQTVYEEDIK